MRGHKDWTVERAPQYLAIARRLARDGRFYDLAMVKQAETIILEAKGEPEGVISADLFAEADIYQEMEEIGGSPCEDFSEYVRITRAFFYERVLVSFTLCKTQQRIVFTAVIFLSGPDNPLDSLFSEIHVSSIKGHHVPVFPIDRLLPRQEIIEPASDWLGSIPHSLSLEVDWAIRLMECSRTDTSERMVKSVRHWLTTTCEKKDREPFRASLALQKAAPMGRMFFVVVGKPKR